MSHSCAQRCQKILLIHAKLAEEGYGLQSELSQGCPSGAAAPTSPAVTSSASFDGANDSSEEVLSAPNRHALAPSNVPILAQQNPKTPKEKKAFRAHCVNQSCIPLNMQARPSMPAIDHSLPEQVAQEWSQASLSAITPGLQELPSDTARGSPQESTQLTFCASQLATSQTAQESASQSHPAPRKAQTKQQPLRPQHKTTISPANHAQLRGPSPLGGAPIQPNRAHPDTPDEPAHQSILQSHAISISQSVSNASTAQGQSVDMCASQGDLMATISGGAIPVLAGTDVDSHQCSTPSTAAPLRRPVSTETSAGSPQRSRSITVKTTPSSRSTAKPDPTPSRTCSMPPTAAACTAYPGPHSTSHTVAPSERSAGAVKVPAIDLSDPAMTAESESRADTPSPSGLSVKQKIKWHETAVAPDSDIPSKKSAGTDRLKRSQSARPAVQVPKYGTFFYFPERPRGSSSHMR